MEVAVVEEAQDTVLAVQEDCYILPIKSLLREHQYPLRSVLAVLEVVVEAVLEPTHHMALT